MHTAIFPSETIISMTPANFWAEARKKLRPHALAWVIEFGQYLMLWAMVAGAHIVRVVMAGIGIDREFVDFVAWLEKWVFLSSFLSFFWRIGVRSYRAAKEEGR